MKSPYIDMIRRIAEAADAALPVIEPAHFRIGICKIVDLDLLNVALFGQTAKQWRDSNPAAEGNLRDHAPLEQLVVLTNLESLNYVLIRQGLPQPVRLVILYDIAITQMRTLLASSSVKRLK